MKTEAQYHQELSWKGGKGLSEAALAFYATSLHYVLSLSRYECNQKPTFPTDYLEQQARTLSTVTKLLLPNLPSHLVSYNTSHSSGCTSMIQPRTARDPAGLCS